MEKICWSKVLLGVKTSDGLPYMHLHRTHACSSRCMFSLYLALPLLLVLTSRHEKLLEARSQHWESAPRLGD